MALLDKVCLGKIWDVTKKAAKSYEYMVFDPKYTETVEKNLKNKDMSIFDGFKDAYHETKKAAGSDNLFQRIGKSFKGFFGEFSKNNKQIKNIASGKYASKLTFWNKIGKTLKPISKRMPVIANLMAVAFAVPTIVKAFTNGGIKAGIKETCKEGFKLGAFTVGAAIGTAIGGPIGGIAGGILASWVADKIAGKSFSEKQEEAEAKAAESQSQVQPKAVTNQQTQTQTEAAPRQTQQTAVAQQYQPQAIQSTKSQQGIEDAQREMLLQQAYAKAGMSSSFSADPLSQAIMPQQYGYNSYSSNPMGMMGNQFNQYGQSGYLNIASNPFMKNKFQSSNNNTNSASQYGMGMNQAMGLYQNPLAAGIIS